MTVKQKGHGQINRRDKKEFHSWILYKPSLDWVLQNLINGWASIWYLMFLSWSTSDHWRVMWTTQTIPSVQSAGVKVWRSDECRSGHLYICSSCGAFPVCSGQTPSKVLHEASRSASSAGDNTTTTVTQTLLNLNNSSGQRLDNFCHSKNIQVNVSWSSWSFIYLYSQTQQV